MTIDEQIPAPLTSDRLFAGLFLAAYGLLLVDLLASGQAAGSWPALLAGAAYLLAGTLGFAAVKRAGRTALTYGYFALMVPLGAALFQSSTAGGAFLLLAVAAQSMRVLPPVAALLIGLPLPLLHVGMAWPDALREGATLLAALAFLYVLSRAILDAERAHAALAAANQQLRSFAAQREELAAARERNRIAREIHDSLGHYLTTVYMQIQAARAILDHDRARAEQTLARAQGMAQEALGDVRRSVAALRAGAAAGEADAPRSQPPLPELLAALVDEASTAGPQASLVVLGAARPLGPQAEQALYRVAQEGLTNVRKHAAGARATLTLDYHNPALVQLSVRDDGQGAGELSGGFGLTGLRERVQLLGGSLAIETAPGCGLTLTVEVRG